MPHHLVHLLLRSAGHNLPNQRERTMLTQDNLKNLLTALGFENKGAIYQKMIDGALLEVDGC